MKALLMLFAALTFTDTTIIGYITPRGRWHQSVYVSEGKTAITVETATHSKLSCYFTDSGTGQTVMKQEHTEKCFGITNDLTLPAYINVEIVNESNSPVRYTLRAWSVPPVK